MTTPRFPLFELVELVLEAAPKRRRTYDPILLPPQALELAKETLARANDLPLLLAAGALRAAARSSSSTTSADEDLVDGERNDQHGDAGSSSTTSADEDLVDGEQNDQHGDAGSSSTTSADEDLVDEQGDHP